MVAAAHPPSVAKQSFGDKRVPKLELGNELKARSAFTEARSAFTKARSVFTKARSVFTKARSVFPLVAKLHLATPLRAKFHFGGAEPEGKRSFGDIGAPKEHLN